MDSLLFAARSCFTRPYICRACLGARQKTTKVLSSSHRILNDFSRTQKRHKVYIASGEDQAKPLEGFYAGVSEQIFKSRKTQTFRPFIESNKLHSISNTYSACNSTSRIATKDTERRNTCKGANCVWVQISRS